jgi:hypothetical protein
MFFFSDQEAKPDGSGERQPVVPTFKASEEVDMEIDHALKAH